jgi:hypothetical protein
MPVDPECRICRGTMERIYEKFLLRQQAVEVYVCVNERCAFYGILRARIRSTPYEERQTNA